VHLRLLRFHVNELNLVKDASGQTNLFYLLGGGSVASPAKATARPAAKAAGEPTANPPAGPAVPSTREPDPKSAGEPAAKATGKPAQGAPPKPARQWTFEGIDRLYLTLGSVRFIDQGAPTNSWIRTLGWKDYEIKNIRTAEDARNWAALLFLRVAVAQPKPFSPAKTPPPSRL
jgi:hypothetical protein